MISREERRARRRELAKGADLSTVGLVFPVAAVLGFVVGRWIGGFFDASASGGLIGMLFGIVSGFYNLWKVVVRLQREDEAQRSRESDTQAANRREGS